MAPTVAANLGTFGRLVAAAVMPEPPTVDPYFHPYDWVDDPGLRRMAPEHPP